VSNQIARKVVASFQQPPPALAGQTRLSEREQEVLEGLVQGSCINRLPTGWVSLTAPCEPMPRGFTRNCRFTRVLRAVVKFLALTRASASVVI